MNHPVMVHASMNLLGSVVLDVSNNQLDAVFLDHLGTEQDEFTIIKGSVSGIEKPNLLTPLSLTPAYPNPFTLLSRLGFSLPTAGLVTLSIYDVSGRQVKALLNQNLPAGDHIAAWSGTDSRGIRVAPGVYFGVLEFDGSRRVRKLTLTR